MKILFPQNWMQEIVPFIETDNDFTLVGSMSQMGGLGPTDWDKTILYNWDHYAFIDMRNRGDWVRFHQACAKALEVWTPTHAHASYFRRDTGIDSYVLNVACVLPKEWEGKPSRRGTATMMSSRKDWYKRFPMFERACEDIEMPFVATHPEDMSREDYIQNMLECNFYVQASIDESLGGLSLMEAVWNKKPVLMSDSIAGGRELYGDTIEYFKWDDMNNLKEKLKKMREVEQPLAFARIEKQTPSGVAEKINRRIWQLKKFT